jgi:hypothetical protein
MCRQEGFPSTADVIAKRLDGLGGSANDEQEYRCASEEDKESLYDMLRWTV